MSLQKTWFKPLDSYGIHLQCLYELFEAPTFLVNGRAETVNILNTCVLKMNKRLMGLERYKGKAEQ